MIIKSFLEDISVKDIYYDKNIISLLTKNKYFFNGNKLEEQIWTSPDIYKDKYKKLNFLAIYLLFHIFSESYMQITLKIKFVGVEGTGDVVGTLRSTGWVFGTQCM